MRVDVGFLVDTVIIVLLLATIGYCWRLNRLLRVIRDSKGELARVIEGFNHSTERAERSVIDMKQASQAVIDKLQVKIEKAEFLADDMSYIMDKAGKVADRLTAQIQQARDVLPEERKATAAEATPSRPAAKPEPTGMKPAYGKSTAGMDEKPAAPSDRRPTSRAEQELLEALRKRKGL